MFRVVVMIDLSQNAIVTWRTVNTTLIVMLSAILGSVSGLMNLSILFLLKTEKFGGKIGEKLEKQQKIRDLKENRRKLSLLVPRKKNSKKKSANITEIWSGIEINFSLDILKLYCLRKYSVLLIVKIKYFSYDLFLALLLITQIFIVWFQRINSA